MSWRTITISSRCKLDLKMNHLVIRSDTTTRINIDEISTLILESTAISVTGCLLVELVRKKVNIIFCDEKRNPTAQLNSLYGCHDCPNRLKSQLEWNEDFRKLVWTEIVTDKIYKQSEHLEDCGQHEQADMLRKYIDEMEFYDANNREGHAAKVYFNALFGKHFSRNDDVPINAALNYGYSLMLSAVNREVISNGYNTQLGLFHTNMFNFYNLSCDLMEPWRIIVDRFVKAHNFNIFEKDEKHLMMEILNQKVIIASKEQYIPNAIKIYCKSVFEALNENDVSLIKKYKYEL